MVIRLKPSFCLALCCSIILLSGCAIRQEQSPEVEQPGNKRCVVLALRLVVTILNLNLLIIYPQRHPGAYQEQSS